MFTIITALGYALALGAVLSGLRRSRAADDARPLVVGALVGAGIVATVQGGFWLLDLYGEKLWFDSLGYGDRFTQILMSQLTLRAVGAVAGGIVAWGIARLAMAPRPLAVLAALLAAIVGGSAAAAMWSEVLLFRYGVAIGRADPVLGQDIGFYLFRLPLYRALAWPLLAAVAVGMVAAGLTWLLRRGSTKVPPELRRLLLRFEGRPTNWVAATSAPLRALLVSAGLVAVLLGYAQYLARFGLVVDGTGFPAGAGFVDVRFRIPALTVLTVLFALVGVAILVLTLIRRDAASLSRVSRIASIAGVGLAGLWVLLMLLVPTLIQRFRVAPNELAAERPYIERSIAFTREAFAIDSVVERSLPAAGTLTPEVVEANREMLREVPLWDYRALLKVFSQFQEIRLYYEFTDVDVDRYRLGDQVRQIMVAARELNQDALPAQSQTFLNKRFKYTHGHGIVAAPVAEFTPDGQPRYLVNNIPARSSVPALEVTRPEIYFGELTREHVYVRSLEPEFDYPSGESNVEATYGGTGGVPLSGFVRKLAYAKRFDGTRLLLARHVTPETRILFRRQVSERAQALAPFLSLDPDPYIVVAGGRLYWIIDAYTSSANYPYSERAAVTGGRVNYLRNSVKVVVDAYHGTTDFYVADAGDPIIRTWARALPALFRPLAEMPAALREHLRYPEGLLLVQGAVYAKYHMGDLAVFYNNEDLWEPAKEKYYAEEQEVEPYYMLWGPSGSRDLEFIQMWPFTPRGRNVMSGWLAGVADGSNPNRLYAYRLPKDRQVLGPLQFEAKIDQDQRLSQLMTLWGQGGANVIRGHVLSIPVQDAILHIEPIYLESQSSSFPELQLVTVMQGDQLGYGRTLDEALRMLFSRGTPAGVPLSAAPGAATPPATAGSADMTARQASEAFEAYLRLQAEGRFEEAGRELSRVRAFLREMAQGDSP